MGDIAINEDMFRYIDNLMPLSERTAFEEQLSEEDQLATELDEYKSLDEMFRVKGDADAPADYLESFSSSLKERIACEVIIPAEKPRTLSFAQKVKYLSTTIAACLVTAVALYSYITPQAESDILQNRIAESNKIKEKPVVVIPNTKIPMPTRFVDSGVIQPSRLPISLKSLDKLNNLYQRKNQLASAITTSTEQGQGFKCAVLLKPDELTPLRSISFIDTIERASELRRAVSISWRPLQ